MLRYADCAVAVEMDPLSRSWVEHRGHRLFIDLDLLHKNSHAQSKVHFSML
jgi:hypothetical protein